MGQSEAIEKARQFARMRYTGETENIIRDHQRQIAQMRSQLAARGILQSGTMVSENARIDGEQIKATIEARLDAILEGYELYDVAIDDQMAINLCHEVIQGMNQMIYNCKCPWLGSSAPSGWESEYPKIVAQAVGLSANLVKTQIDRRRLMTKKKEGSTTIYNVQGDNARWNVNSIDNSVNVVTKSNHEFFTTLRERIEGGVPEGDERKLILQKLFALQESHGQPSFAQRYTDFIATAANHVALLTPFIPALTEMLHNVLK